MTPFGPSDPHPGDVVRRLIAAMPGHREVGAAGHVVPVWVSRSDIAAVRSGGATEASVASHAAALRLLSTAVRQPVLDSGFRRTGAFLTGADGLSELEARFGTGGHRKLYFDHEALVATATALGSAGRDAVAALAAGSAARQRLVDGRQARRAAAKALPVKDGSGDRGR